jgi:glycosyltransferase involved in cell wall biosynthesis
MKIALLLSTRYFEDFYGGHLGLTRTDYLGGYRNDWSWDWVEMLAAENITVSIYVPTVEGGEHARTEDGVRVRFLPIGGLAQPWLSAPVLSRSPVGRWVAQIALSAAFLRPLSAALAADEIDLLCVQEYWTGRFDLLARAIDVPLVAVDQGLPDRREIKWLKRGSFARTQGAIVQTEREARKLDRWGAQAVRIPNAVRSGFYTPSGEHGPQRLIVCVSRLHDTQKRLSDVIRALALLDPHESWTLEIAGVGPDEAMLHSLARRLGVTDQVRFLGFVKDRKRLRELYRSAAAFALPSSYEGLPMVLLEAMSCGTPVVGSDIPAIAEVLDDGRTGLIVPVGDPAQLAQAVRTAWDRREEIGAAGRAEILRTYDQSVVGPRLRAFLGSAAAHAR